MPSAFLAPFGEPVSIISNHFFSIFVKGVFWWFQNYSATPLSNISFSWKFFFPLPCKNWKCNSHSKRNYIRRRGFVCHESRQILADSGFSSYDNYEHLSKEAKDIYVPDQQMNNEKEMVKIHITGIFFYQQEEDCLICLEGKQLLLTRTNAHKRTKQKSKIQEPFSTIIQY
ncbi:MAG: hypothetical protein ABIP35_12355 [Ginsengibacter sp.]